MSDDCLSSLLVLAEACSTEFLSWEDVSDAHDDADADGEEVTEIADEGETSSQEKGNRRKRKKSQYDGLSRYHRTKLEKHILTRIVKSDIRRKYPLMYSNVMTSGDEGLIADFVVQFACGDCSMTSHLPTLLFGVPKMVIDGVAPIATFLSQGSRNIPDAICTMINSRIIRKSGTNVSLMVLNSRFQGTMFLPSSLASDSLDFADGEAPLPVALLAPKTLKIDVIITTFFYIQPDNRIGQILFAAKTFRPS